MGAKSIYSLLVVGTIALMVLFFSFNPSYEKSLEAKYYYVIGEYKRAHALAKESATLDAYNKMAITIVSQSERAIRYVEFIEEAELYLVRIEKIAKKEGITPAERAKISIMCQVILGKYSKLSATIITDEDLVHKAQEHEKTFKNLYEKVSKSL